MQFNISEIHDFVPRHVRVIIKYPTDILHRLCPSFFSRQLFYLVPIILYVDWHCQLGTLYASGDVAYRYWVQEAPESEVTNQNWQITTE